MSQDDKTAGELASKLRIDFDAYDRPFVCGNDVTLTHEEAQQIIHWAKVGPKMREALEKWAEYMALVKDAKRPEFWDDDMLRHNTTPAAHKAYKKLQAYIEQLEQGEQGWMPIETAPKGKDVDLWAKHKTSGLEVRLPNCHFNERLGCWLRDAMSIEATFQPTHWRPEPAKPL